MILPMSVHFRYYTCILEYIIYALLSINPDVLLKHELTYFDILILRWWSIKYIYINILILTCRRMNWRISTNICLSINWPTLTLTHFDLDITCISKAQINLFWYTNFIMSKHESTNNVTLNKIHLNKYFFFSFEVPDKCIN